MYKSLLNIKETQIAIKELRDFFQERFSKKLNLLRVSAPMFLDPLSGLNDGLSGEKPVSFTPKHNFNKAIEIIHSLAKWKRYALAKYKMEISEGIYTNMNAIRQEEIVDDIHSIYVDQWDWEKVINKDQRTKEYLFEVVNQIYDVLLEVDNFIASKFHKVLSKKLPKEIFFIDSQELEDLYPNLIPEERENEIAKEKGAVFIWKIGHPLNISKKPHSARAVDYDDWTLNGDIIVYDNVINKALELSSMGIRVDKFALKDQSKLELDILAKKNNFYYSIINEKVPYSIGGGIGQSRVCMFFLEKKHIGEVQVSTWPDEYKKELSEKNIFLL